jgi:flagellar L-ring protein precursor FlgH
MVVANAATASAQNSSLFQRDLPAMNGAAPLTIDQGSWTYVPTPPPQQINIHDKVAVRVDIKSRMVSDGQMQRRKTNSYDTVLSKWVQLNGLTSLKPAGPNNNSGDVPEISGQLTQQYRALGNLQTSESLKYEIAAEIVDIRPNGMLVLEAHQNVKNNEESWDFSLSGYVNPKDIGPGGVVLSRDILDMRIDKREHGHTRDSYKRGWFQLWLDEFINPF